jgi:hypothetical protein
MQEMSGDTYKSGDYAKVLAASDAKVGKTTFLAAQALGAFPNQKYGGIVDKPSHLHILTFDANALGGLRNFITKSCKKPDEYLKYRVYNHQDEFRRVSMSTSDWNYELYNAVQNTLRTVSERAVKEGGTHLLLFSSLTGLAEGILRAIAGPPDEAKKGSGMDPSKWSEFARQLVDIRNFAQVDTHHCVWEAHIDHGSQFSMKKNSEEDTPKESIHVPGQAGRNWGFNVEQIFRIRRTFGDTYPGTDVDKVFLDTRPSLSFVSGGRSFTELLDAKEGDMTLAFHKLGLKIGRYGAKPAVKAAVKK